MKKQTYLKGELTEANDCFARQLSFHYYCCCSVKISTCSHNFLFLWNYHHRSLVLCMTHSTNDSSNSRWHRKYSQADEDLCGLGVNIKSLICKSRQTYNYISIFLRFKRFALLLQLQMLLLVVLDAKTFGHSKFVKTTSDLIYYTLTFHMQASVSWKQFLVCIKPVYVYIWVYVWVYVWVCMKEYPSSWKLYMQREYGAADMGSDSKLKNRAENVVWLKCKSVRKWGNAERGNWELYLNVPVLM